MCRAIGYCSGAVDGDYYRKFCQSDIVVNFIQSPLQKSIIKSAYRAFSGGCQSGGKSHGMGLGDAGIKTAIREFFSKRTYSGTFQHCRAHRTNIRIFGGKLYQCLSECLRKAIAASLQLSGIRIAPGYPVITGRFCCCEFAAVSFFGNDM